MNPPEPTMWAVEFLREPCSDVLVSGAAGAERRVAKRQPDCSVPCSNCVHFLEAFDLTNADVAQNGSVRLVLMDRSCFSVEF